MPKPGIQGRQWPKRQNSRFKPVLRTAHEMQSAAKSNSCTRAAEGGEFERIRTFESPTFREDADLYHFRGFRARNLFPTLDAVLVALKKTGKTAEEEYDEREVRDPDIAGRKAMLSPTKGIPARAAGPRDARVNEIPAGRLPKSPCKEDFLLGAGRQCKCDPRAVPRRESPRGVTEIPVRRAAARA